MKPGKIIGRILLFIFIAGVFAILGRIFMMDDNGSLTKITPTESAKEAFASLGKEAFATHKFRASIAPDGYYSAHSMVYNRSQRELQLTARYNESIYKYMDVADGRDFYWELRDEEGNTISRGTVAEEEQKYFYRHFRLVFSDVTVEEGEALYLFLCCDAVDYPKAETIGFPVHQADQEWKAYKLDGEERAALS